MSRLFIDAVRATGGNNAVRNLIVQGPSTDIGKTDNLFGDMPTDVVKDRLMVEVHYYTPWTFCGLEKDEDWGRMAYFWGDYKVERFQPNATSGDMTEMSELFAKNEISVLWTKEFPLSLASMVQWCVPDLEKIKRLNK